MYYIYNMRKTILIFIACMFRACLSVMAQRLPDTTIAPAKPQAHVTIPAPSWGYSLSLGGIMNPYMYISGLGKYFNIATTKWVKSKYPTKTYVDSVDSKRAISGYNPSGTIDANSVNLSGGYILDSVSTNIRNAPFPSISVSFIAAGNGVFSGSGLGRGAQLAVDNFSGAAALRGLGIAGYTPWYNIWTTKKLPLGTVGQSIRVNSDETGFESYTPSAGNSGTVTSIIRGIGLVGNGTSITTTGSIVVDTTVISTKSFNNSLAPKNSPAFTGIPTAPTAATGTNTTQIATTAGVRSEINSLVNKNLAGGYGINALFYSPISQAASISVDTTQVKSKPGALIDYTNLSNRINAKQGSLPAYTATQILYGDGSSTPVSDPGFTYTVGGSVGISGTNSTLTMKTTNTTANSYAGLNLQNDAGTLAASIQIGGTNTAALVRNNLFLGARIPGQSTVFVNGNVSNLTEIARFDGSGRFGVGVPSPLAWIDVKANTATVPSFKIAASATAIIPAAGTAGGFYMAPDYRPHVVSTTVDNSLAYLTDIAANARTPIPVSSNLTMILNADYLNVSATQYTLTLPATTGFPTDGSKIITVLATGAGGLKVLVPSGYALQSGTSFATTTGTGGFTLTQGQKGQLIPIGTNSYYLQPLYGTITLY